MIRKAGRFALVLAFTPCAAQQWDVFDMAGAGFPSDHITALAEGPDHTLWVGTDWGLLNGQPGDWTIYQTANSGLPSNAISCLAFDDAGRLWVGTVTAGIGILDQGMWSTLTTVNSPLRVDEINGIDHDHLGRTWIATPAGLHRIIDGEWVVYDDSPESHDGQVLFGPHMRGTVTRNDGLVAVYTRNAGLIYIDGSEVLYHTSYTTNFFDNSGNGVVFDAQGDRWVASPAAGLVWHFGPYDEHAWLAFNAITAGLPDNTATCVALGPGGRKYVGTEIGGLVLFDAPGQWSVLDPGNSGLPDQHVTCLRFTTDGALWVGTFFGGLARYSLPLEVPDRQASRALTASPNPFAQRFHLRSHEVMGEVEWIMMDLTGAVVRTGKAQFPGEVVVNVPGLSKGTYLLQTRWAHGGAVQRLVAGE